MRRIYLDGNSLGPPSPGTADALAALVAHWERSLIGGWNEGWWDLPVRVGDRVALLLGAAPGQVVVGDSATVMWFKAVGAALRLRPDRTTIVTQIGGFPTDRHAIDALGARVVAVGPDELVDALGQTYKYLNGGPGSPAFAYVAERHLGVLDQPLPGWVGHADPFSMSEEHQPAPGIRRMLSGTPWVLALAALDHALGRFDGVDPVALRARSLELTDRFLAGVDTSRTTTSIAPRSSDARPLRVKGAPRRRVTVRDRSMSVDGW